MPTRQGSIKLFRLFGIDVYVHWTWFITFYILPKLWDRPYSNYGWNALEVLGLFLIVLMHEFGHQLACRQVGGKTNDIVLWPLGGVAYVNPPQRPSAQLWSIAAGPLVNVILIPIFASLVSTSFHMGWHDLHPDAYRLIHNLYRINIWLIFFNLIPVFPLDGGQILRSLLWFPFGRANSLLATSIIGFIGVGLMILLALFTYFHADDDSQKNSAIWLGCLTAFIFLNCWGGLRHALALAKIAKLPRRAGFACPSCQSSPPLGEIWRCGNCGKAFDTFQTQAVCPHCGVQFSTTQCFDCGESRPMAEWRSGAT
jgi:Zn-dependent protease